MPEHQVDLPGAIHLIPSMRFVEKLAEQRARYPFLPDVEGIRRDLGLLASQGPVPARVESGRAGRGDFLKIYIDGRYVLFLNVTKRGNGYSVSSAFPMGFEHHDEIVRATLRLQAPAWILHHRIQEMPFDAGAHWDLLQGQWRRLDQGGRASFVSESSMPKAHEEFLDALDAVIEEGRRVELAAARTDAMISYRRVEASAARRRSARSVHDFQLIGSHRPLVGARLHVRGAPDLRGRVDLLRGTLMTVRFERPVDLDAIPRVGAFVESPSTIPFDRQAEAVRLLREGRSANPHLLDVLAAHRFRPFTPPAAEPARALDASQRSAFCKALAVPDAGLILGPPGTGKTRTITEIARACAATGERILVTSYTNRAVDNVLQELPTDLMVLRVGRDDGVTPGCEHLTLEEQATSLQGEILRRTEAAFHSYAPAGPGGEAVGWLRQLDASIGALREAEATQRQAADALRKRAAQLTAAVDERARGLTAAADEHRRELAGRDARLAALADNRDRAEARTRWPLIGPLLRGRADRFAAEHRRDQLERENLQDTLNTALRDQDAALDEARRIRESSPELLKFRSVLDDASTAARNRALAAAADADELRALIHGVLDLAVPGTALPELDAFRDQAARALDLMRRRLDLLAEWRGHLGRRTDQLYPELARYADVIGATCIGAATAAAIRGLDFALAIVDEAGQISTPNVLVPLVRARRAILVGDHNQLPPFVDGQVERWARDDPRARGLVTKSAFELLFPGVPEGHREILRYQRRMPPVIARFVSRQFYNGFLESDVERPHRDALFDSPLVFVDTAGLPQRQRHERRPRPDERWAENGYANDAEARVITDLVGHYDGRVADWAVILPYQAQVGLVTEMLAGRIGDDERAASGVGTVDSFQGGERDLIVFGFTRSNASGAIGFLNELRRANVAFSRPRRLLILVGDSTTLTRADDPAFRTLAESLLRHIHESGASCDVREIRQLIAREEGR